MSDIKSIFFGNKNIQILAQYLGNKLNIDDTHNAQKACKNLLVSQMELVFNKNRDKILKANPKKIIPKLNQKSISECIKAYNRHMNKNLEQHNKYNTHNLNKPNIPIQKKTK
jgi:hypothetical protein